MSDDPARTASSPAPPPDVARPGGVSVPTVCVVGSAVWALVLAVTLLVPALHTGDRSWWPWTAAVGLGLGVSCGFYVRRGRGNAATA